jgi:hypothetical protein
MKSPFFSIIYVLGTVTVCAFFLWCSGTIAAAAATETGLDTPKIESITSLKGVLNEKENTFKTSKPKPCVGLISMVRPFCGTGLSFMMPRISG